MKKSILFLLTLLAALSVSAAQTESMTIVCGDISSDYATSRMQDLTKDFEATYLSESDRASYKQQGYKYIIAGRNCGLEKYDSSTQFEVLYLFQAKNIIKEAIDLGPFSIYQAKLEISGLSLKNFTNDLLLEGNSKKSLKDVETTSSVTATLSAGRGLGKVRMIIRRLAE